MSELEAPSAEFRIISANRQAVKDWLAAQGFDATRVQSMRDQTLLKAYTDPRYLRALTNRGDYNPSAERNGTWHTNPTATMAEAGLDSAPAGPENTQGVAAAQAGGCCRECGSLTEARVIELIRALAVLKPGLEGLEDLL